MLINPLAQTQAILNAQTQTQSQADDAATNATNDVPTGQGVPVRAVDLSDEGLIRQLVLEPVMVRAEVAVMRSADESYQALLRAVD